MGVSKNRGTPKWMVYNGKPYQNGWFGGTTIFGNTQIVITCSIYYCGPTELFGHLKVQMLGRLPDGPARKNFENQVCQSCAFLLPSIHVIIRWVFPWLVSLKIQSPTQEKWANEKRFRGSLICFVFFGRWKLVRPWYEAIIIISCKDTKILIDQPQWNVTRAFFDC